MTKFLPIFGLLFCFTVSSCALYQELLREQDSSATTKATQNSSNHRSPNQAHKQTTPRQSVAASAQTKPTQTPSNPQTTAANTPQATNTSTQVAENQEHASTTQPSVQQTRRTTQTPLLPKDAKVVCYSYSNICDDPPEGKLISTNSDELSLIVNDHELISPWDYNENAGLKVFLKLKDHDKHYKIYIHKAIASSGGTSQWCDHSYQLSNVYYDKSNDLLAYLIEHTQKCGEHEYDEHDNVIGTKEEKTIYKEAVMIDTVANAIIAEYTAFWKNARKTVNCELTSDNTNWIYKCDNEAPIIQPIANGGFYQSSFEERLSYSTSEKCMYHAVEDVFSYCTRSSNTSNVLE